MSDVKHIVSFSGGKDSTAMLLMMIEKQMPIDEIIFLDTGVEFPQMYQHIEQVEQYIGRTITKLKNPKGFEYYMLEHIKSRGKYMHVKGFGFPNMFNRWCTANLKTRLYDRYIRDKYHDCTIKTYVGIASDEREREKDKTYPLIEWGITERMALDYCIERGFDWGGLYNSYNRVSCWCCPLQRIQDLRTLYHNEPELWEQLKTWQHKLNQTEHKNKAFKSGKSVDELDERFKNEDKQIRLKEVRK